MGGLDQGPFRVFADQVFVVAATLTADSSATLRNDKQKDRQLQKQEQPQVLRFAVRASLRMTISLAALVGSWCVHRSG
jgi:hypothetical protein